MLPDFERLLIKDVKRGYIKDFLLEKVNSGYAKSTVSHMKDVISGVLNKAMDDEIIVANPTYRPGKFIKAKDPKENINPLTSGESKTLLVTAETIFSNHYALFLLLARTGMRIGEALTLQWGDIDFKGRFIDVKRSVVRGKVTVPKSGKSRRVDMSLQLTDAMKIHSVRHR